LLVSSPVCFDTVLFGEDFPMFWRMLGTTRQMTVSHHWWHGFSAALLWVLQILHITHILLSFHWI